MVHCSRCSVEDIIRRCGPNGVVELIGEPMTDGWIPYEIYTSPIRTGGHIIEVDGKGFQYSMTLFSEKHSLDEDCKWAGRGGFPNIRIKKSEYEASRVKQQAT